MKKINQKNLEAYAWNNLTQFHNIDYLTKILVENHKIDSRNRKNAKLQAEQIKFCLIQAKEYFDAANIVSLSTKPVMQYYGIMSMALAEILFKNSAEYRLQKIREKYNCHGLKTKIKQLPNINDDADIAMKNMIAVPQATSDDNGSGVFDVWHESSREYPAGAEINNYFGSTCNRSYNVFLIGEDIKPEKLKKTGLSLNLCVEHLPYMEDVLLHWGCRFRMIRATLKREIKQDQNSIKNTYIIHPATKNLIEDFGSLVRTKASFVNNVEFQESSGGVIFSYDAMEGHILNFPSSITIDESITYFSCDKINLNEFGLLYICLHIIGNFARYYPDNWIKQIENNSPLINIIRVLCDRAQERLPLLLLSEMTRMYHINEK